MIAVLNKNAGKAERDALVAWLEERGLTVHISEGEEHTVLGLVGDSSFLDADLLERFPAVRSVHRISEPYKKVNRLSHSEDSVVEIGNGVKIGGGNFCIIAGPCSVESREQIFDVASVVKAAGANVLRGGAFKPRTSPYDFQGLKAEGLELLSEAKKATGLPVVSEIMNIEHMPLFEDVDIIQVGARNVQNYELLKELGLSKKPVLLKRGIAGTIKELLMSAEYVMAGGNENIILCERGIRTYETSTRNTLDLSAVPVLQRMSHLPVVVDPSHAT
ncbi:MAG: 3-deoxy-7-phosphoheptulonate synthase, partial [Oscillospiraceae bacterium]|nr:3-deoxy-7-phosphoheptulonate synthase [Oscillospiraceae bacterium]